MDATPIIINKPTYKCPFCRRLYQIKRYATEHVTKCKQNPENKRICHHCRYLQKVEAMAQRFDQESIISVFWCDKVDSYLYPAVVEHSWYGPADIDGGMASNIPMKQACDHFGGISL